MKYILVAVIALPLGFLLGHYAPRPAIASFITFLVSFLLLNVCSLYGI